VGVRVERERDIEVEKKKKKKQIEGEKIYLGLGIVGITSFSFASFHAKHPLKFHVGNYNIVSFWSHICCCVCDCVGC
jgi:hypothetical protein